MISRDFHYYKRIDMNNSSLFFGLNDLEGLEEEVFADQEIRLIPEEDFIATVDLWWGDFLSDVSE